MESLSSNRIVSIEAHFLFWVLFFGKNGNEHFCGLFVVDNFTRFLPRVPFFFKIVVK